MRILSDKPQLRSIALVAEAGCSRLQKLDGLAPCVLKVTQTGCFFPFRVTRIDCSNTSLWHRSHDLLKSVYRRIFSMPTALIKPLTKHLAHHKFSLWAEPDSLDEGRLNEQRGAYEYEFGQNPGCT